MVQLINPLAAVSEGQQFVDGIFTQRANRQAGAALQQGNYNQAAGALFGNGDLRGGMGVQQYGQEQQAAQQAQTAAQKAQQLQATLQIVGTVKRARDQGQDVSQILPQYRDAFIAMGTDPQQLMQIEQQVAANPDFLDQIEQIVGQQARELEIVNLGGGTAVAVDKGTGREVNRFEGAKQPINVGGVLVDPQTYEPILDTREPKYQTIQNTDGSTSLVAIDQPAPIRGEGGAGSFESVIGPLLQREGGFVAQDGRSGAPANFGINQRANPDVDVRNLTPERAAQLYRDRYWEPVVRAGVPEEAREAVFDFAVNAGPARAIEAWRRSGGDINAFNQARLEHYRRQPDYAQNGRSWERRVAETTPASVGTGGGVRVVAQGENRGLSPAQQQSASRESRIANSEQRRGSRQLREDFEGQKEVKDFNTVRQSYEDIRRLTSSGSATDDMATTFAFMRMLDPTSVVRESEYALVGRAQGITGQALVALQRVSTGQSLTPQLRKALVDTAETVYQSRQGRYNQLVQQYRNYAQEDGFDPDRVIPLSYVQGNTASASRPWTNAPGLRFNISEQQLATRQRIVGEGGRPSSPLGSTQNPRYLNPSDPRSSYNNVRSGEYYVAPDGQLRRKP